MSCKTSIGNISGSIITWGHKVCPQHGFSAMADRMVRLPSLSCHITFI